MWRRDCYKTKLLPIQSCGHSRTNLIKKVTDSDEKYVIWVKMKRLSHLCPEEEEWPAPWPWPPPPPIAAGSNVRATLGYINILRLASFIFLNHNMRCLRQCKKGFPYLVSLGFGFEVWLSSYRWRRGGDIRRSVQVRVWRSHWLGGRFAHLSLP